MTTVGIRRTVYRRMGGSKQPSLFYFRVRNAGRYFCGSVVLRSIVGQLHPISCPVLRQQKAISPSSLPLLSQKSG